MVVALGKVVGAHGVRGELRVVAYSGSLEALEGKDRVFLRLPGGALRPHGLRGVKPHKGGFLVRLAGINDRDTARALAGSELALPEAELPPLADDEFYWFQLVGLEVETTSGARLGRVGEIMATGAADVLVVQREGSGELLIPATPEVVKRVSLAEGRMVIEPPEGLIEGPGE
jgi:16S rRNA processing protein RimM